MESPQRRRLKKAQKLRAANAAAALHKPHEGEEPSAPSHEQEDGDDIEAAAAAGSVSGSSSSSSSSNDLTFKVLPDDNVYTYFMYMGPIEHYRHSRFFTWDSCLAWVLVMSAMLMQLLLLGVIYFQVVGADYRWRQSIMGPEWKSHTDASTNNCNSFESLCATDHAGMWQCAPPTVQLTAKFDELDTDGDGVWTREEVEAARDDLKCQYGADPLEMFDAFRTMVTIHEDVIWVDPNVSAGIAIPKPYFDFASGDINLCVYRSDDMCPNLLKRGIFDGPLADNTSPRVGNTTQSALDYCYNLLGSSGMCSKALPSTYSAWMIASETQCQDPKYSKFVYSHPTDGTTKSMLDIEYVGTKLYVKGKYNISWIIYKFAIVGLFVMAMVHEVRELHKIYDWVKSFPAAEEVDEPVTCEDGKFTILGIERNHRIVVGFFLFLRILMCAVLSVIGLIFLLQETDYVDLLLNAVGLVFIMEIANSLYSQLVSDTLRETYENSDPMNVPVEAHHEKPARRDMWVFLTIGAITALLMFAHYQTIAAPLYDALECACMTNGNQCVETTRFSNENWDNYWSTSVPAILAEIDGLHKAADKAAVASGVGDDLAGPDREAGHASAASGVSSGRKGRGKKLLLHSEESGKAHPLKMLAARAAGLGARPHDGVDIDAFSVRKPAGMRERLHGVMHPD